MAERKVYLSRYRNFRLQVIPALIEESTLTGQKIIRNHGKAVEFNNFNFATSDPIIQDALEKNAAFKVDFWLTPNKQVEPQTNIVAGAIGAKHATPVTAPEPPKPLPTEVIGVASQPVQEVVSLESELLDESKDEPEIVKPEPKEHKPEKKRGRKPLNDSSHKV